MKETNDRFEDLFQVIDVQGFPLSDEAFDSHVVNISNKLYSELTAKNISSKLDKITFIRAIQLFGKDASCTKFADCWNNKSEE